MGQISSCCSKGNEMVGTKSVLMSNGVELPLFGLGSWLANDTEALRASIRVAIQVGYRYFDTARLYGNEGVFGDVLQEFYDAKKLKRSDVFICTKLAPWSHRPELTEKAIKESLRLLRTDYIDLFLIHTPMLFKPNADATSGEVGADGKFVPDDVPLIDTWRVLEKFYKQKVFRSIGISNFSSKQIRQLLSQCEIRPHNLQVELHLLMPQKQLVQLCRQEGITVTSFATLGSPGRTAQNFNRFVEGDCLNHPLTKELSKKYGKTPAQILLRHVIQKGISVIPKSTNAERLKENINIFDFEIEKSDIDRMDGLNLNIRLYEMNFADHHPNYPFRDPY